MRLFFCKYCQCEQRAASPPQDWFSVASYDAEGSRYWLFMVCSTNCLSALADELLERDRAA